MAVRMQPPNALKFGTTEKAAANQASQPIIELKAAQPDRRGYFDMNITLRQMWKRENPLPQYAFKMSMFNVSAIHINSRSWLRSSSTHEPSDPPLRIVLFDY
jgi:hypothetical protein